MIDDDPKVQISGFKENMDSKHKTAVRTFKNSLCTFKPDFGAKSGIFDFVTGHILSQKNFSKISQGFLA